MNAVFIVDIFSNVVLARMILDCWVPVVTTGIVPTLINATFSVALGDVNTAIVELFTVSLLIFAVPTTFVVPITSLFAYNVLTFA